MKAAMIAQFKGPVPGRERESQELMAEVNEVIGKLVAEGTVDSADWFFGTFGPNFHIVKGEMETLLGLQTQPEMRRLMAKSQLINDGFESGLYVTGEDVTAPMQAWTEAAKELGYM